MSTTKNMIIALDSETSGLEILDSQILSLTLKAIDPDTRQVVDRLRVKVGYRGECTLAPEAVAANRLNPLRHEGVSEASAAKDVSAFFERHGGRQATVLGHNVDFDTGRVRNLLTRSGLDATIVPLSAIDTQVETARAIFQKRFPLEKLRRRRRKDGVEVPSLKQTDVATALDIEVDSSRAHDDEYDVDKCIEIWGRLGHPGVDRSIIFNNPYETQRLYRGKVVTATVWNGRAGELVEKSYYVTGEGAEDVSDAFGTARHKGAILVEVDNEKFAEVAARLDKAGGNADAIPVTKIKDVTRERTFNGDVAFAVKERDPTDEELRVLSAIAPRIVGDVRMSRHATREKEFQDRVAASAREDFELIDPQNKSDIVAEDEEKLVPQLAREMSGMDEETRHAHISQLANSRKPCRGTLWAHTVLVMAERFGYRNGIPGFEAARRRDLEKNMPPTLGPVEKVYTRADANKLAAKAMAERGVGAIMLVCDGVRTSVVALDDNGRETARQDVDNEINPETGWASVPKVEVIDNAIMGLTGISKTASSTEARKDFRVYADNESFPAIRRRFAALEASTRARGDIAAADALAETLADMGTTYEDLFRATAPRVVYADAKVAEGTAGDQRAEAGQADSVAEVVPLPSQAAAQAAEVQAKEARREKVREDRERAKRRAEVLRLVALESDALRGEASEAYDAWDGVRSPQSMSSEDIIAANLRSEAVERHKTMDAAISKSHLRLVQGDGASAGATTETASGGSADPFETADSFAGDGGEHGHGVTRCKVCNRSLKKGKNVVAGMGPVCARKLGEWLDRADATPEAITSRKFKRLADVKDPRNGQYPIMIVRDVRSGRTFAADVLRREKDGRYLVIDLSEVARMTAAGRRRNSIRDALRIYLEPQNFEVTRIFGGAQTGAFTVPGEGKKRGGQAS